MINKLIFVIAFVLVIAGAASAYHFERTGGCSLDKSMLTPTVRAPTYDLYRCSFNFYHPVTYDSFYDAQIENLCFADEQCTSGFLVLPPSASLSTPWIQYKKTDFSYGLSGRRFNIVATPIVVSNQLVSNENRIMIQQLPVTRDDVNRNTDLVIRAYFNLTESTCSREFTCTDINICSETITRRIQNCRNGCNEYFTRELPCLQEVTPEQLAQPSRIPIFSDILDMLSAIIANIISLIRGGA